MKINTYAVNCNDAWLNTDGDDISGSYVKYKDHREVVSALEAQCAALAAELKQSQIDAGCYKHGMEASNARLVQVVAEANRFKRFFMFAINAAFDGCDITGDQIQEVAKDIGLVRVEPYSESKHAEMSGDPSIMEEGDDFYIMNKTPAITASMAEFRAQGVEMVIAYHRERADALNHVDRNNAIRHSMAALDASDVAAQLLQDANTAELVAAGIITKVGE